MRVRALRSCCDSSLLSLLTRASAGTSSRSVSVLRAAGLAATEEEVEDERPPPPRLRREALVVTVMAELAAGERSAWGPYLAALPPHVPSPACWSPSQLDELAGTSALARLRSTSPAEELPSATARAWETVSRSLARRLGLPPGGAGRALHLRATTLVAACSFTLGDDAIQAARALLGSLSFVALRVAHALLTAFFLASDGSVLGCAEPHAPCVRERAAAPRRERRAPADGVRGAHARR